MSVITRHSENSFIFIPVAFAVSVGYFRISINGFCRMDIAVTGA